MDSLNKDLLVLEGVTLGKQVKLVVKVSVNLVGFTVLFEQAAKNADAADPQNFEWHARIGGTLALTLARVAALGFGLIAGTDAAAGVHDLRLANDETIFVQLADILARVGHGDVVDLIRVEPDLALAALKHGCREAFLKFEGDHDEERFG